MIRDQAASFEYNRKKEVPKILKFDKENFLVDLTQINWNHYLDIYKSDAGLCFNLFLKKNNFYIIRILH